MYIDMGYPDKAVPWLTRGLEKYAEEEEYLAVTADCFLAQGLKDKAEMFYNKLIDKNPDSAPYWFGLALCYFEQELFDKAIEACDYAIVSDEEFADAYMMKGHAFYQLGNEESALENYTLAEKYKAVSPNFLHMFIGFNEISKGHWEEGYRHLELVIHSKDTDSTMLPSLYAHVAICLYNLGEKRQADLFFKKAHEIGPKDAEPYLIEGGMYMEKGDFDKAVKKWALALECAPCADTWNEIGISSMETGHIQYAQTAFEQVKKLEPDFENINEKLTALYLLLDDMENFLKYNQLCAHPFQAKDLENMLDLLDCKNRDEMIKRVKEIFGGSGLF